MCPSGGANNGYRAISADYGPDFYTETETVPAAGCQGLLQEDGTKSLAWKFVGAGQGSFTPQQSYEYVGQGRGAYEKEEVITPGRLSAHRLCLWVALPLSVCLMILGGLLALAFTTPDIAGVARFDCEAGLESFETKWSVDQQRWCCLNAGKGCAGPESQQACQSQCTYLGHTATCAFRVQWGANHRFRGDPTPCASALAMVASQCPMCQACPLAASRCVRPR